MVLLTGQTDPSLVGRAAVSMRALTAENGSIEDVLRRCAPRLTAMPAPPPSLLWPH